MKTAELENQDLKNKGIVFRRAIENKDEMIEDLNQNIENLQQTIDSLDRKILERA